jgi:hypothetical protein
VLGPVPLAQPVPCSRLCELQNLGPPSARTHMKGLSPILWPSARPAGSSGRGTKGVDGRGLGLFLGRSVGGERRLSIRWLGSGDTGVPSVPSALVQSGGCVSEPHSAAKGQILGSATVYPTAPRQPQHGSPWLLAPSNAAHAINSTIHSRAVSQTLKGEHCTGERPPRQRARKGREEALPDLSRSSAE